MKAFCGAVVACLPMLTACGSEQSPPGAASAGGNEAASGGHDGITANGGATSSGGIPAKGGAASGGKASIPPATGTPGVWENVTSPQMDAALFTGSSGFGVGNIVTDPARPTDMYVGGYGSIWKSVDYGLTWNQALEAGGVLVGDQVSITIDLEANKDAAKGTN